MQKNNYTVVNIRDYLSETETDNSGEHYLRKTLEDFSCPLNSNIELFLKSLSIEFAKKKQSVTYLVFSNKDKVLAGYFTLAMKPIIVKANSFSKTMLRKFSRVGEYNDQHQTFLLSAYLIAQFGKNFNKNNTITGAQLMKIAIQKILELQYMLGGVVVFLETEQKEKLMDFYAKENGFKEFDVRKANSESDKNLVQMLKLI